MVKKLFYLLIASLAIVSCNNEDTPTPTPAILITQPNKFAFSTVQRVSFKLDYGSPAEVRIYTSNPMEKEPYGTEIPFIQATTDKNGRLDISMLMADYPDEFYALCPTTGKTYLQKMTRTSIITPESRAGSGLHEEYTYSSWEKVETSEQGSDPAPGTEMLGTAVITQCGVVGFEDSYPGIGDWDMNDVMLDYQRQITVKDGYVEKIVDFWEFFCDGSSTLNHNAFGYELFGEINAKDSTACTITRNDVNVAVEANAGTRIRTTGLDEQLTVPTVMLLDNINLVELDGNFTVTTTPKPGRKIAYSEIACLNHNINPFIVITLSSQEDAFLQYNRTECHPSYYRHTAKFNTALFDTIDDKSDPSKGIYFVRNAANPYPFAIHCLGNSYIRTKDDGTEELLIMPRMIVPNERELASVTFPNFASWYGSNGIEHKDWYYYEKKESSSTTE